jgi:hypothetical protein
VIVREVLDPLGLAPERFRQTRVTVEDAFVSMVRADERSRS